MKCSTDYARFLFKRSPSRVYVCVGLVRLPPAFLILRKNAGDEACRCTVCTVQAKCWQYFPANLRTCHSNRKSKEEDVLSRASRRKFVSAIRTLASCCQRVSQVKSKFRHPVSSLVISETSKKLRVLTGTDILSLGIWDIFVRTERLSMKPDSEMPCDWVDIL